MTVYKWLALWHSSSNEAPEDPNVGGAATAAGVRCTGVQARDGRAGWMYRVRQYGMHTLLMYFTEVGHMVTWPHSHISIWSHGHIATWPYSHMVTW